MIFISLFRGFLLFVSILGYILFLSKMIRVEFAVSFICAAIPGCLFFAGILNLLPEAALLLFAGGLLCFVLSIRKHIPLTNLICFGALFLLISGAGLFYVLYGSRFANQDIFDHWGTVIRILVNTNRFPDYLIKYLPHKTYTTGTACWIYYWLYISGTRAEWVQIFAQNVLFLGMAVSLFPLARRRIDKILTAAAVIMMLCGNQELFSIQVDNILAITALSAISFGVYYREELQKKNGWLSSWCVFLPATKSSGLLFAFFVILLVFPWIRAKRAGLLALVTGCTVLLWSKHTDLVFTDAAMAKHAVSISNYRAVLGEKSRDDIINICRMVLEQELSLQNPFFFLLLLGVLLTGICYYMHSEESRLPGKLAVYSIFCYVIHELGLLGTYLVSMPLREALVLAHYTRYQKTAVVFCAGLLLMAFLLLIKEEADPVRNRKSVAAMIICSLLLFRGIRPHMEYFQRQRPETLQEREYYDQVISGYEIPDGCRIMTFTAAGEDPHNYFNALTRYYFAPASVHHCSPETVDSLDLYDYILVLTESEEARNFVKKNIQSDQVTIIMK